eukprot:SAG22_NODE_6797_length_810_cov_0.926864_2_plen_99_part_01
MLRVALAFIMWGLLSPWRVISSALAVRNAVAYNAMKQIRVKALAAQVGHVTWWSITWRTATRSPFRLSRGTRCVVGFREGPSRHTFRLALGKEAASQSC